LRDSCVISGTGLLRAGATLIVVWVVLSKQNERMYAPFDGNGKVRLSPRQRSITMQ